MMTHDEFRTMCTKYQDRPETREVFKDYVAGAYLSHYDLYGAAHAVKQADPDPQVCADMEAVSAYVSANWKAFD